MGDQHLPQQRAIRLSARHTMKPGLPARPLDKAVDQTIDLRSLCKKANEAFDPIRAKCIIGVEERDESTSRQARSDIPSAIGVAGRSDLMKSQARVSQIGQSGRCVVRRTIVHDDDFQIRASVCQNRLDRSYNSAATIPGRNND
jgi:hypothetical protein